MSLAGHRIDSRPDIRPIRSRTTYFMHHIAGRSLLPEPVQKREIFHVLTGGEYQGPLVSDLLLSSAITTEYANADPVYQRKTAVCAPPI